MALKDNVKRLRGAGFLSQAELAKAAGVSKGTIVRIEAGTVVPYGRTVRQLADALGVEPGELVTPEELKRQAETGAE